MVGPSPAIAGERAATAAVEALAGAAQRRRERRSTEASSSSSSSLSSSRPSTSMPTTSSSSPSERPRGARSPSTDALRGGGSSSVGSDPVTEDKKPGGWWPFGNRSSPSSSSSSSSSSNTPSTWGSSSFFAPKNSQQQQHHHHRRNNSGPPPPEERILISEIVLQGIEDDSTIAAAARSAMTMRPNFAYTLTEVHEDVRRIFDTGFFTDATPVGDDTRDGVRLTVALKPYPKLRSIVVTGADALPTKVIQDAFAGQAGKTINFGEFRSGLDALSRWYDERGIPAKVSVPTDRADGSVDLHCAEPRVNSVSLVFVDRETGEPKAAPAPKGGGVASGSGGGANTSSSSSTSASNAFADDNNDEENSSLDAPVVPPGGSGYTKPEVVLRQLRTSPGLPWSSLTARADIDAVYATGLFEGKKRVRFYFPFLSSRKRLFPKDSLSSSSPPLPLL